MTKKTTAAAMGIAVLLTIALAVGYGGGKAALAAPNNDKQADSRGIAQPAKANSSSQGRGHKLTICHNGHPITVDEHSLRAGHQIATTSDSATAANSTSSTMRTHQRHLDTLLTATGSGLSSQQGTGAIADACSSQTAKQKPSEQTDQEQQQAPQEISSTTTAQQDQDEQQEDEAENQQDQDEQQDEDEKADANGTETVKSCDGKEDVKLSAEEKRILDLHNETRKKQGLESLCVNPKLTGAARSHSKEMLDKNYFSHTSKDGKAPGARLKGSGYDWRAYGENIAWGSGSMSKPEERFKAWMKSSGHRRNILERSFKEVGVGVKSSASKKGGNDKRTFYTVEFGTPRGAG